MKSLGMVLRQWSAAHAKSSRKQVRRRQLRVEPLERRALLSVATSSVLSVAVGGGAATTSHTAAAQHPSLAGLPAVEQGAISAAIGRDQAAYHAQSGAAGVSLANQANGFAALVRPSGALHLAAGANTWDLSLLGISYGGAVQPVASPRTVTNGNRVDSNYAAVDEWFVNGPAGLEQGFTLPPLSRAHATGSLTLALALGGNLKATANAAGNGVSLLRPGGLTALGYTGLAAYDASGKALPATMRVQTLGGRRSC